MLPLFCAEVFPRRLVQMRWQHQRNDLLVVILIIIWEFCVLARVCRMIRPLCCKEWLKYQNYWSTSFTRNTKSLAVLTFLEIMLNDIILVRLIYSYFFILLSLKGEDQLAESMLLESQDTVEDHVTVDISLVSPTPLLYDY